MQRKTILALAIFAAAMIAGAGYLISQETQCLYQPYVQAVAQNRIYVSVFHYVNDSECDPYCSHGCGTSDGTIYARVYDSEGYLLSTIDLVLVSTQTCYTAWAGEADYPVGASYVIFYHKEVPGCQVRVNIE